MVLRAGSRRRVTRPPLLYWPLAGPFLLAAVVLAAVLVAFLLLGVLTYALARLGIGPASQAKQDELAIAYARDGYALLEAVCEPQRSRT